MEQPVAPAVESVKTMSALAGVAKFLFKPREVFESLHSRPLWVLPLLIAVVLAVVVSVFIHPVIVKDTLAGIAQNANITEEQRAVINERITGRLTLPWIIGPGLVFLCVALFGISAIFFFVANVLLGGEGKFTQMLSIVGLSFLVGIPEEIVKLPMILAKQTMKIHTDLSVLLPVSMEDGFLFKLLGHLDIFAIWRVFLIGLGMAVVYKFKPGKAQSAAFAVWGLYVIIATVLSSFMKIGMG